MRILCLTPRLPYPPDRGDRLRAFHLIEHLSREHELDLVSFVSSEAEHERLAPLLPYCREVHIVTMGSRTSAATVARNLWRRDPLQVLYYRSKAMRRLVGEVMAQRPYDAAYIHLFRMAPYLADYPQLYRIVDLTDVISKEIGMSLRYRQLAWRLLYQLERPRVERYERWVAQNFEETWLISEADRQILAAACPEANIQVVPNGVDIEQFYPTGQPEEPNRLIFVGHMRVLHNVDAVLYLVRDILPLVREQMPACSLYLVGANPAPEIQRLGSEPGITVTGFVPDLNEYLNRASIFVAPLRFAAGVQNKALEAMAAGRPVVTTGVINSGLGTVPGRDLLVADHAAAMADAIVALLRDDRRRAQLGQAARAFVQQKYCWDHAVERIATIERILRSRI